MPRGKRENIDLEGESQAPVERSRRALVRCFFSRVELMSMHYFCLFIFLCQGDVSNKESKDANEATKKRSEGQTLRRSRRLSNETSEESLVHDANPAEELAAVARRQPLRATNKRLAVNPFAEPLPTGRVTRKRTSKSVEGEDSKLSSTKRSRTAPVEVALVPKNQPEGRDMHGIGDSKDSPQALPSTGNNHCQDILTSANHVLQRKPFSSKHFTPGIGIYDMDNKDDVLQVPNYVTDIFQRLFNAEVRAPRKFLPESRCPPMLLILLCKELTRPKPYMEKPKQPELNGIMRSILVDWLVEVHMKFRLLPETLYLCVNIIDRYLEKVAVNRNRLQLVGVTALLIACKYEEIYPPEVKDCVYITDRAYTRQDVLDMEAEIVKTLKFCLTVPTGHPFLQRFLHIVKASPMTRNLANYYMERMLQEHSALDFKPSLLAATAVCLAQNNPTRIEHDDYSRDKKEVQKFVSFPLFLFGSCG